MDYNNINKDISNTNRDEITAAVDFAYKTIDTLALYAREKSDSVIDMLSKVSPNEMCNFGIRNGIYMMRLMRLNEKEREITLNALGTDAVLNGDSSSITGAALSPSYAKGYNYVDTFVNIHKQDISSGVDVTSTNKIINHSKEIRENLYYDDNGTGKFYEKIQSVNLNSILNKTKRLFNQHKINTIISRFHTDNNLTENSMDVRTEYGLSHGRNLLKGDVQREGKSYSPLGYDNPYCRVWTHHYQYDNLAKRIRPFMGDHGFMLAEDFHKWKNFKNDAYYLDGYDELTAENNGKIIKSRVPRIKKEYGWKDDTGGRRLSVLGDNGFVNITPKFQGGGEKNIHTKQCMFSIENLAWKDYDPYSFEKALSWEQRGPMGGRIMWFPPYGISFNETTSTNWNSSTFIGRGEDIYTYINTVRTGTLNFMLLVDHPSILDYVSWGGRNNNTIKNVSDDDVHRFFAGCDNVAGTGGSNETGGKLSDYAKPTPLTDEYTEIREENTESPKKKPKPTKPEISPNEPTKIIFYVFFPNNYAGYYDRCDNEYQTNVEAIPYLLYGKGAQMKLNEEPKDKDKNPTQNLPLTFEDTHNNTGGGYEMKEAIGDTYTNNYIVGSKIRWQDNTNQTKDYKPLTNRKWYYRIDGKYVSEWIQGEKNSTDAYTNCYDQKLLNSNSYKDKECYHLNCDIANVKNVFNEDNETDKIYTLAEVAQVLTNKDKIINAITNNIEGENDKKRIKELEEIFSGKKGELTSVKIIGYSNSHDVSKYATKRNVTLAQNRANTVKDWLRKYIKAEWQNIVNNAEIGYESSKTVEEKDKDNESGKSAKKWRSARVVMCFKNEESNTLSDANQQENSQINTGENLINDIIKEIEKQVIHYRNADGNTLTENEKESINNIIKKNVNNLSNNYLPNVKSRIEDVIKGIIFSEEVYGGKFTLWEEDGITTLIKDILNMSTVDSKDKMTDDDEFEQKLGILIEEDIKKLKKVKNKKEEFEKIYENCHKDDTKIENLEGAILVNGENITTLKTEIKQIEDELYGENLALESLKNEKKKIEEIADEREKKHKLNKINKEIEKSEKKIKDLRQDLQDKRQEISDLKENNRKLYEQITDTDDGTKDDYEKWQYSQKIDINSDDIDNVINDYFKEGNVKIDDFYRKQIVNDISTGIAPKIHCEVRHKVNDINAVPNNVIIDITFESGCYEIYNDAIKKGVTDSNNTAVNIDKGKLAAKLKELEFVYNGDEKYRNRYAEYELVTLLEETGVYNLPFDDNTVNIISNKLSEYATKEDVLRDINSIKSLLNDEFKKYLYIYIVSVDNTVIKEKSEEVKKILTQYNENMDKSEYVGFSKHIDENTGETYYINENATDKEKKNKKWVEELDKDGNPTGKLVLKYIDGVETRASVEYNEQNGIINTNNIKGDFNKSRYDQEYYFFSILKDKDRMTYDKVMQKIQYFDPAFHSMTPEGFSARLNFLNQCMRAGNTVTASDGIHAKSANNLAFGRPPFCVLRLGDWYNQMIVIDNISINYDPLVWDLNEEGIGVIPLIANVSMSFKFIGGGDLGGPVRRLQNAMSFNYYANGRLYDNRSDRMKYNWDNKTCGALKGNEIDIKNSYFYTAQNYEELDTIN